MIYRMKQNAVGLANICILSTMVLVTLSTTVSLYIGQEGMRRDFYPLDVSIVGEAANTDFAAIKTIVESEKDKLKVRSNDEISFDLAHFRAFQEGGHFLKDMVEDESTDAMYYERISNITLIPLDDYNRLTGANKSLAGNEMLIFSVGDNYGEATIVFGDDQYLITEQLEAIPMDFKKTQDMGHTYYLIVKDDAVMEAIYQTMKNDDDPQTTLHALMFNLEDEGYPQRLFRQSAGSSAPEQSGYQHPKPFRSIDRNFISSLAASCFWGYFGLPVYDGDGVNYLFQTDFGRLRGQRTI